MLGSPQPGPVAERRGEATARPRSAERVLLWGPRLGPGGSVPGREWAPRERRQRRVHVAACLDRRGSGECMC